MTKPESIEPVEPNTLKELAEKARQTPEFMTEAELEVIGKTTCMNIMGRQIDEKKEQIFIAQCGHNAFRKNEPGRKVGECIYAHHGKAEKAMHWILKYKDSGPYYVPLQLPTYRKGEVPWLAKKTCGHYLVMSTKPRVRLAWKFIEAADYPGGRLPQGFQDSQAKQDKVEEDDE